MRRGQTRVGIVGLLAATLLVLAGLVLIARYPALFRRGTEYQAVFRSVAGLNPGDEVRYGGLLVGTVTSLDLDATDPTRIVVRFRVREETPMRTDTRATISQVGLLGQPYLNLRPGGANAPALAEGGTVPSADSPSFQDAMSRLASFLDRADSLLRGAERMASASPLERIDRTLARIDTFTIIATRGTTRTFGQLDRATAQLSTLLERSDRLIVALDTTVRSTGPGLATTQREALQAVRELRLLAGDLRDAMQQEGGIDQLVRNMAQTADNLARLTDRIERDPTSVLQRRANPVKVAGPRVRE